eukprot:121275-Chlamydomonas_euryale.AAC.2
MSDGLDVRRAGGLKGKTSDRLGISGVVCVRVHAQRADRRRGAWRSLLHRRAQVSVALMACACIDVTAFLCCHVSCCWKVITVQLRRECDASLCVDAVP